MKNIKVLLLVCVLFLSSCGKNKENLQNNKKTTYSEESVVLEKSWTWEVLEDKKETENKEGITKEDFMRRIILEYYFTKIILIWKKLSE